MALSARSQADSKFLLDLLLSPISGIRDRRKPIEWGWLLNYRAWQGWPSLSNMIPLEGGATHYFVPFARRVIEKNIQRIVKLAMPQHDWFHTSPMDQQSFENAEAVQALLSYIFEKKLSTKRLISTAARSLELYNFSPIHTSVKIENSEVWPTQYSVDPFTFYVFPDYVISRDDALMMFEDVIVPYQVYRSFVNRDDIENSLYLDINVNELSEPKWPYHLVERLAYRGLSSPEDFTASRDRTRTLTESQLQETITSTASMLSRQQKAFVSLTKTYFRLGSEWYFAVICNNTQGGERIVRVDQEEHTPLYHWTNTRPMAGELYTNSDMDDIRVLQNMSNNTISQVEQNRQVLAGKPRAFNSTLASRTETYTYTPNAKWMMEGDPKEATQEIDIEDLGPEGIRAFQIYYGIMNASSGGTLPEGQPGRNMPRAGFAMQTLANLSLIDSQDAADTISLELLSPGLADIYHVIMEYCPSYQFFKIPGSASKVPSLFSKDDLYGDYTFSWQSSKEFQDNEQLADRYMKLLEVLLNPVAMQLMQQQGELPNISVIVKKIYSLGLGVRGISDLFIKVPPPQQQQDPEAMQAQQELQLSQQQHQQDLQHSQQSQQLKLMQGSQDLQHRQQLSQIEIASKHQQASLANRAKILDIHHRQEAHQASLRQKEEAAKASRNSRSTSRAKS